MSGFRHLMPNQLSYTPPPFCIMFSSTSLISKGVLMIFPFPFLSIPFVSLHGSLHTNLFSITTFMKNEQKANRDGVRKSLLPSSVFLADFPDIPLGSFRCFLTLLLLFIFMFSVFSFVFESILYHTHLDLHHLKTIDFSAVRSVMLVRPLWNCIPPIHFPDI